MERIFKIVHIPTGLCVSSYIYLDYYYSSYSKNNKLPSFRMSKKGRSWKRYCDILIAWKTIHKKLKEKKHENLINDHVIEMYEVTFIERLESKNIINDIKEKDNLYEQRKLKERINSLNYRISKLIGDVEQNKNLIPALQKELEKLKNKIE